MLVLGISFGSHDSAAALVQDGTVVAAAEEERFTREKHTKAFPGHAIQACLDVAGATHKDVEAVALFVDPRLQAALPLVNLRHCFPEGIALIPHALKWLRKRRQTARLASQRLRQAGMSDLLYVRHHLAHAASAFLASPFDCATVVVIDGRGEYETASIFRGEGSTLKKLHSVHYPHSIGYLYSAATRYLGFVPQSDEYKVMGLAAYGADTFVSHAEQLAWCDRQTGQIRLNLEFFDHQRCGGLARRHFTRRFSDLFGPPRDPDAPLTQRHADVARAIQRLTEGLVCAYVQYAMSAAHSADVCLAGGVALNCVANAAVVDRLQVRNMFVPPAANDPGAAIGAALATASRLHDHETCPRAFMSDARLGPDITDSDVNAALLRLGSEYIIETPSDVAAAAASLLHHGSVLGWCDGRMEFGPRALGSRSILASASDTSTRDRINRAIKKREEFRPFAPVVRAASAHDYFDVQNEAALMYPFMLATVNVHQSARCLIPAVTHVDGTARLQVVPEPQRDRFAALLSAYERLTGVGVLLNTSFNVAGEPLVCSPSDAVDTFIRSGLDALVLKQTVVRRRTGGTC